MLCLGKITLPQLEDCSQVIHSWRIHLSRSEQTSRIVRRCVLSSLYTGSRSKQYEEFVDTRLIRCKKSLFLIQLRKIILLTPAKSTAKVDPKKTPPLKESDFNK